VAAGEPRQSGSPRIPPGTRREIGFVNSLIASVIGRATGGPPPRIFTTLARHRRLFRAWLRFAGRLMPRGTLPRRDTELVILRVAHNCGCEYEWRHHVRIGARAGLSKGEIKRVREGPDAAAWATGDAALLRAVDELHRDRVISDATWRDLAALLSDTQLIELCMLAGHYEMLAMTLLSIGVEPDEPARRRTGPERLGGTAAACVAAVAIAAAAPARSQAAAAPVLRSGEGLRLVSERRLDPRLLAVAVRTAALPGPANIRILLPRGYAAHPRRRYPVLYLIHGTSGGASDWTKFGHAAKATAGRRLIVVMPDIALNRDGGGWCSNWPSGAYDWETFHIDQLLPWIDGNLRTRPSRGGRAIAGLSQGGFCSTSYAARHPDLFGTAFSYSGAPDIFYDPDARAGAMFIINGTEVALDHVPANSIFGDPVTDAVNWAAHDPATLAENLRATRLFLFTGNGQPGPLDSGSNLGSSAIEGAVHESTHEFHNRLEKLGIPSFYDDYGPGLHTWPYWARDLRQSMGPLMASFKHPARVPHAITYRSADDSYAVYGWRVQTHRAAREFSYLSDARCSGFAIAGSGSASVTTPRCLQPGRRYRVRLRGDRASGSLVATASRTGRLRLDVPLGPANPYQQYTVLAGVAGTAVYRTQVSIRPAATSGRGS
jgi:S-formylglutathione hydrolase FrmB/alkylhydroperoxidase family enzyme